MSASFNGTTGLTFPNGSTQDVGSVGTGSQTWQNVAASRAVNTTYTNTTGKPIMVNVVMALQGVNQGSASFAVNGVTVGMTTQNTAGANSGVGATSSGIVPNGGTYGIFVGVISVQGWTELR
jgi:hypothetical protein